MEQLAHRRSEPRRQDAARRVPQSGELHETGTAERTNTRIAGALRAGLTKRGIEVLRLVAAGASTAMIAESLGLSPQTVQNHLQRIYSTLDVNGRAGAIVWWMNLAVA